MVNRFAFLVDRPDEENRQEYACAGESLTPEEAVQRVYDGTPDGTEIIKPLRGAIPSDLDLSPPDQESEVRLHEESESKTQSESVELSDESEVEEFADGHWKAVQSAVLDGDADDFLDSLASIDDRDSVQGAVAERRKELENDD